MAVNPWMILPFVGLLLAIAVMPLAAHRWWERNYPVVSVVLGCISLGYYLLILREFHRPAESLHEYLSFIVLLGSLFVVAGGIHIRVKGESTPLANVVMLAIGGVLANLIGTTGASMVLIRPWLRANKYRITAFHIVFFIFIVGNVGGCLTPVGDPPLYLGYLNGVPFSWTVVHLWPMWLIGMGWLLLVFFALDRRNFLRAPAGIRERETSHETWKLDGSHNLIWLGAILAALFLEHPPFAREAIMLGVTWLSWRLTPGPVYEANDFSWAPIREVAILFAGIFATMMPALDWLEVNAVKLGIGSPGSFYWAAGSLSSVLDNAPTYLTFLSAAIGLYTPAEAADRSTAAAVANLLSHHGGHIMAISIGAVFFGACTYIGNGPNFMVKSIADHAGVRMPSFFGYVLRFTVPILLPMFTLVWWLFFR